MVVLQIVVLSLLLSIEILIFERVWRAGQSASRSRKVRFLSSLTPFFTNRSTAMAEDELSKKRQQRDFEADPLNFCLACEQCGCSDWKLLKSGLLECSDCETILPAEWSWL